MKIVAFLQCLWAKDPARVKASLADMEARGLREAMLCRLLFNGGHTGNILRQAFGTKLCGQIVWEESTKEIAGKSNGSFPADIDHIATVLTKHQPRIVLAFGSIAIGGVDNALRKTGLSVDFIQGAHPATRMGSPLPRFALMREQIEHALAIDATVEALTK